MKRTIEYAVGELTPYINWVYFFHAWGMAPKFAAVSALHDCRACRAAWVQHFPENERGQAQEAERLMDDARGMLADFECARYKVRARLGLFPAWSEGDDIVVMANQTAAGVREVRIPLLRQQRAAKPGEPYLCLADFVSPVRPKPCDDDVKNMPPANVLGIFATAVVHEMENAYGSDAYRHMLAQTLADRLAEAAAEKLHEDVRRNDWGYAPKEALSSQELFSEKYQGRRPAVGYPSLPDQSLIFLLDDIVDFETAGISLTESGMMVPHAAVAGLMLSHPAARHFSVGPIDEEQLEDYAKRRGKDVAYMKRFLAANLCKSGSST